MSLAAAVIHSGHPSFSIRWTIASVCSRAKPRGTSKSRAHQSLDGANSSQYVRRPRPRRQRAPCVVAVRNRLEPLCIMSARRIPPRMQLCLRATMWKRTDGWPRRPVAAFAAASAALNGALYAPRRLRRLDQSLRTPHTRQAAVPPRASRRATAATMSAFAPLVQSGRYRVSHT